MAFLNAAVTRGTFCRSTISPSPHVCLPFLTSPSIPPATRRPRSRACPHASIEQEVSDQMKAAMRAKDATTLSTLRSIRAAFLTARKAEGGPAAGDPLPDEDAMAALRKLAKMRRESIEMYAKAGRDDLAEGERKELEVIEGWLPKLADEGTVKAWVMEAVEATGAKGPGDMGKVMGVIMKKHRDEVDGNVVRGIVTAVLKQ